MHALSGRPERTWRFDDEVETIRLAGSRSAQTSDPAGWSGAPPCITIGHSILIERRGARSMDFEKLVDDAKDFVEEHLGRKHDDDADASESEPRPIAAATVRAASASP